MICWWLGDAGPTCQQWERVWEWYKDSERWVKRERESNCLETGGCSRILICLLSPGSNWAPQDVVIFKSDMSDPAHLRCVIMHQAQRCGLKLSLMLCALGFIFPIKSANYMIIQSYAQGPFWKWVAMVCFVFFPFTNGNVGNAIRFVVGILIRSATVQLHCALPHCDSKGTV